MLKNQQFPVWNANRMQVKTKLSMIMRRFWMGKCVRITQCLWKWMDKETQSPTIVVQRPSKRNSTSDFNPLIRHRLFLTHSNQLKPLSKEKKWKKSNSISSFFGARNVFCSYAPTLSYQTNRKIWFYSFIYFLTHDNNTPVHLVKQCIYEFYFFNGVLFRKVQFKTHTACNFHYWRINKNKSEVAACECVSKCQSWR